MTSSGETTHYRSCHLCEAICGVKIMVDREGEWTIRGDAADPFSRGHICPKAVALQDIHNDPDRLRRPMKREGNEWKTIGWEEALEYAAARLASVHREFGAKAVGVYMGNPSVHNYGVLTHVGPALGQLKTRSRFSATSVDQLPHQLVAYWLYGHQLLVPVPDIDHGHYLLMLGANPIASNGSMMTVPDFRKRIKALRARGGKWVVIDPRRTESAELADEHHFIRPGTDAFLLAALLNTLLAQNLARPGKLAELATAPAGICYGRMGLSTQEFGTICQWLIQLINIACGNLDRPGGVLFTKPAVDVIAGPKSRPGHFARWHSRVSGLPEFSGELPVAALAEEITTGGEGRIRAMITIAGNPVLSTPDGRELERALAGLDFMVSQDFYLNETSRHAHLILPPTSPLEHDHFDLVFNLFAVRNTVKYSPALFEKPPGSLHDWEILQGLGGRLAFHLGLATMEGPEPAQIIDQGLLWGPYGEKYGHPLGLSLKKLMDFPHGIDLGPLEPSLPQRLGTPDKRIHCAPPLLLADLKRLREFADPHESKGPLLLIGRRQLRGNNSWMHNYERLVKGGNRCQLLMNPADMRARGLQDGQIVRVRSRTGEIHAPLRASENMMPGVVSLPHGYGHARAGVRLGVAGENAGVSINDLTDARQLDRLSGNAAVNGVPVTINAGT